jgi:hypothetical protein
MQYLAHKTVHISRFNQHKVQCLNQYEKGLEMLKRILIGLTVMIFILIGIHLSWGGCVGTMGGRGVNSLARSLPGFNSR